MPSRRPPAAETTDAHARANARMAKDALEGVARRLEAMERAMQASADRTHERLEEHAAETRRAFQSTAEKMSTMEGTLSGRIAGLQLDSAQQMAAMEKRLTDQIHEQDRKFDKALSSLKDEVKSWADSKFLATAMARAYVWLPALIVPPVVAAGVALLFRAGR